MTLEEARLSPLTTVAGLAVAAAAIVQAASAWQVLSLVVYYPHVLVKVWVWTLLIVGVAAVPAGFTLTRGRPAALITSGAASLFGWLVGSAWALYAMVHGLFTLISVVAAGASFLAVVLTAVATPATLAYWRARRAIIGGLGPL